MFHLNQLLVELVVENDSDLQIYLVHLNTLLEKIHQVIDLQPLIEIPNRSTRVHWRHLAHRVQDLFRSSLALHGSYSHIRLVMGWLSGKLTP